MSLYVLHLLLAQQFTAFHWYHDPLYEERDWLSHAGRTFLCGLLLDGRGLVRQGIGFWSALKGISGL